MPSTARYFTSTEAEGSGFLSGCVRSLVSGIITMVRDSRTPGMRLSALDTSPPSASMNMARSSVWVGIIPLVILKMARPSIASNSKLVAVG